jgi:hypothetical protein
VRHPGDGEDSRRELLLKSFSTVADKLLRDVDEEGGAVPSKRLNCMASKGTTKGVSKIAVKEL